MLVVAGLAAVFLATFALASMAILSAARSASQRSVAEGGPEPAEDFLPGAGSLLRNDAVSTISLWAKMLEGLRFVDHLRGLMSEADVNWSVGRATALMLLAGAVATALLSRASWISGLFALSDGLLAASIPYFYIRSRRAKRLRQFEEYFPDALDSLARAMRAGHPFAAGMDMLASESSPPVSLEMRRTFDEWKLGRSWEQALEHLAQRIPLVNVSVFVAAIKVQSRTGGKLHEVLGRLAETMRESFSLEGEVRAIAAHGRLTGIVLTVLPIGIAALMMIVNPGYLTVLVEHPYGKFMIGAAIACLLAAHFVIRRILDIHL